MIVRDATPDDFEAVARLLAELGRPEVLGTPEEGEHRLAFEAYRARGDARALVAVDGERVVGFCDLEFRARLNFLTEQAWIPDLIVTEEARSKGAGAALLARAREIARERGAWGLQLESASWRERAHAFYEREGLEHVGKTFNVTFGDRPWPPPAPIAYPHD